MKNIIYTTLSGTVAVISPSPENLDIYGIQAIALKDVPGPVTVYDVPTGTFEIDEDSGERHEVMGPRIHTFAFKIVDTSSLPTDYSFFGAWEADMSNPDGVGSESNEFPKVAA